MPAWTYWPTRSVRLPTTPSTGDNDGRIGEVELGLALHGLVMGERRLRLGELGLDDVDLPDRRFERGLVARDGGAGRGERDAACCAFCTLP